MIWHESPPKQTHPHDYGYRKCNSLSLIVESKPWILLFLPSIYRSAWNFYSTHFVVTEFSEVQRFLGALSCFVPWRTYTPLRREYDAFVTWPAEAA
jgi:hypothetical protein